MKHSIPVALLMLALCGCQKPASDNVAAETAPVVPQAAANLARSSENGMLTIDPAVVRACPGAPESVAAKVKWDASSMGVQGAQVWMQAPGEEKKLWLSGLPVGEDVTGPWLRAGSTVTLTIGEEQKELARVVVSADDCK